MPNVVQMEEDSPSAHRNGRLPILDMEFWVKENIILHQFYKKPMATRKVTLARSALSSSQKRSILVQEGLRRLANYSPNLPWSEKIKSLNLLCIDMYDCGHSENFRTTIMSRVVAKYKKNLDNHMKGIKTMFRTKEEREEQINATGGRKTKANWFRNTRDNTTTTMTVPTTPGGLLLKNLQTSLASCPAPGKCRTKVLEGEGVTVQRQIVRSNPFPRSTCGRPDCVLDQQSDGGCKEQCYQEGVGYCSTCSRCRENQVENGKTLEDATNYSYTGETARPLYTRAKQHLDAYRSHMNGRTPTESWMWDHTVSHHGGVVGPDQGQGDYNFRLQGKFSKSLNRQVDEAVRLGQIDSNGKVLDDRGQWGGPVISLNSRGEYFRPRIMQYNFEN